MQRSDNNQTVTNTHHRVQSSMTLNRKYVKRPVRSGDVTVSIKRSPKVRHFNTEMVSEDSVLRQKQGLAPVEVHPIQQVVKERSAQMAKQAASTPKKMTAKEIKDQEIKKALANASKTSSTETKDEKNVSSKMHFGFGKVVLAMTCAAAAVFAIVYFVNLNMPDLSLKVAAMQTGIETSYPGYVPRDYKLTDIASEDEKITLNFNNAKTGDSFTIVEEKSSWDSNALLNNYVKGAFNDDYQIIKEQGLTIYVGGSGAAWVNGGIMYKLNAASGSLTKKQIRSIAVSL